MEKVTDLQDEVLLELIKNFEKQLITLYSTQYKSRSIMGIEFEISVIERQLAELLVEAKNRGIK